MKRVWDVLEFLGALLLGIVIVAAVVAFVIAVYFFYFIIIGIILFVGVPVVIALNILEERNYK